MPATVIAERIGWSRSVRVLRDRVAELRPVYRPPDPSSRTSYEAGEVGQCDFWFPDITLPVGFGQTRTATRLPVLVMVCGYSRWLSAVLIPSRSAPDLFAGWWQLLGRLDAVPRMLVWDGEAAVGRRRGNATVLTGDTHAFRGTLGTRVHICAPADPEAKGLVESANGYPETSFLPGRSFVSPADFNAQLDGWLAAAARARRRLPAPKAGRRARRTRSRRAGRSCQRTPLSRRIIEAPSRRYRPAFVTTTDLRRASRAECAAGERTS
jgi:transposase